MSVIDGQISIFDVLAEIQDKRPMVTCPHCGGSWRIPVHSTADQELHNHTGPHKNTRECYVIPVLGECVAQSYDLFLIAMKMNLMERGISSNFRTGWDLLGCILRAKTDKIPDQIIQQTLTESTKE